MPFTRPKGKSRRPSGWNKYGAKKTSCLQGHKHDSQVEAEYCNKLAVLKKHKHILDYFIQLKYNLIVKGFLIGTYRPDFLIYWPDGRKEIHEVKGEMSRDFRLRANLFVVQYPKVPYFVIQSGIKKRWTCRPAPKNHADTHPLNT